MSETTWDAIIIGGGVAGLSAAQMLGRARRRTLVIDGGEPRNRFAAHMHGVLGHDGRDPLDLVRTGRSEAAAYGVAFAADQVSAVSDEGDVLRVETAAGGVEHARAVVIASGIVDELPPVDGLAALWGSRVLHCPYCHGWEVRDQRIGVIATSPASLHQIELVRQWTDTLTAFTADLGPIGDDVRERLDARRIVLDPLRVTAVAENASGALAVTMADGSTREVDALFVGPEPVIDLTAFDALDLHRNDLPGRPLSVDPLGQTSHRRVWAAGNAVAPYANVPVSMGAGSMAGAGVNAALVAEDAHVAVVSAAGARA